MKERMISILSGLMEAKLPLSIDALCLEHKIGRRMLRAEIGAINDELLLHNLPLISIIRGQGYTLELTATEERKIRDLLLVRDSDSDYFSREERMLDLLLAVAFDSKPILLTHKERSYQVSKSTMDEDMRRIRSMLNTYDLSLVSQARAGLALVGLEKNIQLMLFSLISKSLTSYKSLIYKTEGNSSYKIISSYLPPSLFQHLDRAYIETVSRNDDLYRRNFIVFSAIWVLRHQLGQKASDSFTGKRLPTLAIYDFIARLQKDFALGLSPVEFNYIDNILESLYRKDLRTTFEWGQAQVLTLRLISHVEREMGLHLGQQAMAFHAEIYAHILALLKRLAKQIQFANPLTDKIKSSYPKMFKVIQDFSPEIHRMTNRWISEDEIALLVIYFTTLTTEIEQDDKGRYKIVVVCNHGKATGNLLATSLTKYFPLDVQAVLSARELDHLEEIEADMIFSTIKLSHPPKPTLLIQPIIQETEELLIKHFLESHRHLRREEVQPSRRADQLFRDLLQVFEDEGQVISKSFYEKLLTTFKQNQMPIREELIQPMIRDVLLDNYIAVDVSCRDWREAIQRAAQPLLEEDIIAASYVEAMIQTVKDYGPYIVIGPHLALAHARPEDGAKQLGLSLIKLKEPLPFHHESNDPVQLVFCLSAIDNFSHLTIMRELVSLIRQTDKIDRLCQAESITSIKQILFEEEHHD